MGTNIVWTLYAFNRAHKKMNGLYHGYAKKVGLSDAAFWLLYSLYEHDNFCTQKDLCDEWCFTPQTLNSALKALEQKGFISLEPVPNNKKNKRVCFTESGEKLTADTVVPLVRAEERAFERLTENERTALLSITQKQIEILTEEINKIE